MRILLVPAALGLALGLAACQQPQGSAPQAAAPQLTPGQKAMLACIGAETGAAVAADFAKGGAVETQLAVDKAVRDVCGGLAKATN